MRHLEENTQIACVRWFSYQYQELAGALHHSPNGGKRNAREAARFKAMGTKAGFPDIALFYPTKEYHALFIELKTDKGRQTESQKWWQQWAENHGYKYAVVRSFEEFKEEIKSYLFLKN